MRKLTMEMDAKRHPFPFQPVKERVFSRKRKYPIEIEIRKEQDKRGKAAIFTSGKLHSYLADIDEQAQERFECLVKQFAGKENVTEQLKADNQMEWVKKMNNIRNRANEIINHEVIYA